MEKRNIVIKCCLTESEYKALDLIKDTLQKTTPQKTPYDYEKKWTNGQIIRACLHIAYCKLVLKEKI